MEFKGTKGKWKINNQNNESQWFNITSDKDIIARTFYGNAEPIVTSEEAHANALLISKASEMLNMLSFWIDQYDGKGEFLTSELIEKSKQLIKEATEI